ncbi:sulfotransferase domain-containing protein [Actinoallomurus rhizosphaericola]|uniref:sulfotransferase domain-containing protein n=1 Tax=Actinoallomurus rhizosphaericola TaxID=2952536 RepID=UPI0020939B87|nr:sulfotransferase domain-containing protein [Actinoallomurus rhizosphaericola]MCO5998438.1 sulfotransferase domain-containing protein [Actinoallomurus rhizosphaericola]
MQELMVALGFRVCGDVVPSSAGRPSFSIRERLAIAKDVLGEEVAPDLTSEQVREEFLARTDAAWHQLFKIWQYRLASSHLSMAEIAQPSMGFPFDVRPELWSAPFSKTPTGLCWTFHAIDVWRTDRMLLAEWDAGGDPRWIFNIRDPRDILLSMVEFLGAVDRYNVIRFPETQMFAPIFRRLSVHQGIDYALSDPRVPFGSYLEQSVTLYNHPKVLSVRFEDLVGPEGGGSAERQLAAVSSVISFLDLECESIEQVTSRIFNRRSFTFNKGRIGRWREVFTSSQVETFNKRFGYLLEAFEYDGSDACDG